MPCKNDLKETSVHSGSWNGISMHLSALVTDLTVLRTEHIQNPTGDIPNRREKNSRRSGNNSSRSIQVSIPSERLSIPSQQKYLTGGTSSGKILQQKGTS